MLSYLLTRRIGLQSCVLLYYNIFSANGERSDRINIFDSRFTFRPKMCDNINVLALIIWAL